jgi:pilus assembly protein CpaD
MENKTMINPSTIRRPRVLARGARVIAFLSLATALAGCWSDRHVLAEADYPNDVRQRHPIAIREGNQSLDLFIGVNRGALTHDQRADLVAFASSWAREGTGGLVIEVPNGTPNARAAHEALGEVRSILAAAGVPPGVVAVRPYRPADPIKLATIRLNYPRMVAEAGPCGIWPRDIGPSYGSGDASNRPYWNFGCVEQRNLAAMVDNPADLVQPRGEIPAYSARRSTVLDKYRKGETTATTDANADKGKISDLGK